MSWFEGLWRKNQQGNSSLEKKEPALSVPDAEVAATVKAAEVQREADNNEAELVLAKLRGELPASDQEHIDLPLKDEKKVALEKEQKNQDELLQYVVILRELEETVDKVDKRVPDEVELSKPLLDGAFKRAAAAIKALDPHSDTTELMIISRLIRLVRNGNLAPYIATYERKHQESAQKIKELQGDKTSRIVQEAWRKGGSQER